MFAIIRAIAIGFVFATAAAVAPARGAVLTVDLSALDIAWTAPGPAVIFQSRALGSGRQLAPFRSPSSISASGRFTIDLPATSSFLPLRQEYIMHVGGQLFPFTMPDAAADLSALIAQGVDERPWAVGANAPPNPRQGDIWVDTDADILKFRAGATWHHSGGGGTATTPPDGSVGFDQLDSLVNQRINDKVEAGSVEFDPDERLLVFVDGAGTAYDVDIPEGDAAAPVIHRSNWRITPTTDTITRAGNTAGPTFYDLRTFSQVDGAGNAIASTSDADTNTEYEAGKGVKITESGVYSVVAQVATDFNLSHASEWGISLLRTNGLTGAQEVIYESAIFSEHSDVVSGASNSFINTVQFPPSRMNADDYFYVSVNLINTSSEVSTMQLAVSPAPNVSDMVIRRYASAIADSVYDDGPLSARVDGLRTDVDELHEFEDALRDDATLVTRGRVAADQRNIAYEIPGAVGVPSDEPDREITVTIATTGEPTITRSIDIAALLAKTPVVRSGVAIGTTNAVAIPEIGGSGNHYIGIDTSGDWFFGTSEAGVTYFVTLVDKKLDIEAFARRSSAALVPPAKLGTGTRSATTFLAGDGAFRVPAGTGGGGGGGLDQDAVDARVVAGTLPPARAGNTDRWDINKLPAASSSSSGTISDGDYRKLSGIETGATADQTGAEMVVALSGETGTGRLPFSAIKDVEITSGDLAANQRIPEAPAVGATEEWIIWNDDRTALINSDPPPASDISIDARIAPFARLNALEGAETEKVQEIVNAFDGGGWSDVAGALNSVPTVGGTVLDGTQYNATTVKATPWGLTGRVGTRHGAAYIRVRIPVAYGVPLARLRLLIGQRSTDPFVDPDPDSTQTFNLGASQIVTHITTDETYAFYSVGPFDKPAGQGWRIQFFTHFELNRDRIAGDELLPLAPTDTRGEVLTNNHGTPEWQRLPDPLGERLVDGETFTLSLSAGTSTDNRPAAATGFSPAFDLDDSDKQNGTLRVVADFTIIPPATSPDPNMSFEQGTANATAEDRFLHASASVKLSEIRDAAEFVFVSTGNLGGVAVIRRPVYSNATIVGHLNLVITRNAANQTARYFWWDGQAGATTPSIRVRLWIDYVPDDVPAPQTGGAGITFTDKPISLALAAGNTATVGTHTNRKVVTANIRGVVLSDWGALTLVADADAAAGISATSSVVNFAEAGAVWVKGSFDIEGNAEGVTARLINHFRSVLTSGDTVTRPLALRSSSCYTKTSISGSPLQQGPVTQHCTFIGMVMVEANDTLGFEWKAYLQDSAVADMVAGGSNIIIRIAN